MGTLEKVGVALLAAGTVLIFAGSVHSSSSLRSKSSEPLSKYRVKRESIVLTDITFTTGITYISVSWAAGIFPRESNITFRLTGPGLRQPAFHYVSDPSIRGSRVFSDLLSSSLYKVQVTIVGTNGTYPSKNYTVATKPQAPQSVSGTSVNTTIISLRWSNGGFTIPDKYIVYYRNTNDPSEAGSLETSSASLSIRNLLPGRNYSIEVVALKNEEQSNKAQVFMVTAPLPPAITSLTASGEQQLLLRWRPDNSSRQSGYEVWYSDQLGGQRVPVPSCSPGLQLFCLIDVSAAGKLPGAPYWVYIVSKQGATVSSSAANILGNTKPKKLEITELMVLGTQSARLRWKTQPETLQDTFEVSYTVPNTEVPKTVVPGCRFAEPFECVIDLSQAKQPPGQQYRIAVVALAGNSRSDEAFGEIHTRPLQPRITELRASGMQSVLVSWQPANNSIQSSYEVTYEVTGNSSTRSIVQACSAPEDTTCNINVSPADQYPGQSFTVSVTAVQFQSRSDPTKGVTNTVPRAAAEIKLREHTANTLVIEWPQPQRTILDGFTVTLKPSDGSVTQPSATGGVWSASASGLQPGTRYQVTVTSLSGKETGEATSVVLYTKPVYPGVPVKESSSVNSLSVRWTPPSMGLYEKFRVRILNTENNTEPEGVNSPQIMSKTDTITAFTDLRPGTLYTILVESGVGVDIYSRPQSAKFYTQPLPPESIKLIEQTETSITILWSAPANSGYTEFSVRIREVENSLQRITAGTKLEATFNGLKAGTPYTFELTTQSGDQSSIVATQIFGTRPYAPQNLQVTSVSNSSVSLKWEGRGYLDGFMLVIRDASQGFRRTVNLDKDTTSYIVNNLLPGSSYVLTAVTVSNQVMSQELVVDPLETRPNAPSNLRILEKSTQNINISWSPPLTGGVDDYIVRVTNMAVGSDFQESIVKESRTIRYSDLQPGATYMVRVFGRKGKLEGGSVERSVVLMPNQPGDVVFKFVGKNSMQLGWEPPINSLYDSFIVTHKALPAGVPETTYLSRETQSVEITGLEAGTNYSVSVYAVSRNETSQPVTLTTTSQPASVTTLEIVDVEMTNVTVQWMAPDRTGVEAYKLDITRIGQDVSQTARVSSESRLEYTFGNLVPGAAYNISIASVVANRLSAPHHRAFNTKPMPVSFVKAETLGTTSVRLTWASPPESVQNEFRVYYQRGSQASVEAGLLAATSWEREYTKDVLDLDPGYKYQFFVNPVSQKVHGETRMAVATTVPLGVSSFRAEPLSSTTMEVFWTPPEESFYEKIRIEYQGKLKVLTDKWSVVEASGSPYLLTGLTPGEMYQVRVATVSGPQASSQTMGSVVMYPLPPSRLWVNREESTSSQIGLEWEYDVDSGYILRWQIGYSIQELSTEVTVRVDGAYTKTATIKGLQAGQTYVFHVYGMTLNDKVSQTHATTNATVKPVCDTVMKEDVDATDNQTVVITYTENSPVYDSLLFTIDTTPPTQVRKTLLDADRRVVFTGPRIKAGTVYTVSVVSTSKDETSAEDNSLLVTTNPNAPRPDMVRPEQEQPDSSTETEGPGSKPPTYPDAHSITLQMNEGSGGVDHYLVRCTSCGTNQTRQVNVARGELLAHFDGLEANKDYTFTAVAVKGQKRSREVTVTGKTPEGVPGPVKNINIINETQDPLDVKFSWESPDVINGILRGYIIRFTGDRKGYPPHREEIFTNQTSFTFRNLRPGYVYKFEIRAANTREGQLETRTVRIKADPPKLALNEEDAKPVALGATQTTITYKFVDPFEDNGDVSSFSVVVSTDKDYVGTPGNWYDDSTVAYQVMEPCADFFTAGNDCAASRKKRQVNPDGRLQSVNFTVGGVDCNLQPRNFCNGNLKPGITYYTKLVAYNEDGESTSTPYSDPYSTVPQATIPPPTTHRPRISGGRGVGIPDPDPTDRVLPERESVSPNGNVPGSTPKVEPAMTAGRSTDVRAIAIGVAVALGFLLLLLFALICWKFGRKDEKKLVKYNTGSTTTTKPKGRGEHSVPISVERFEEHYQEMAANSYFKFTEQFEALKYVGRSHSRDVAQLPVNASKNRFTNVLPYDHSRVTLVPFSDVEGSDYINASYIPGRKNKYEYIATQGPLPDTCRDFWQMVWEKDVHVIIMLTKCIENGKDKCDFYWPQAQGEQRMYGAIQVELLNEFRSDDFTKRELTLFKGGTQRRAVQYHYTSWPDFSVPEHPQSLISFIRKIRSTLHPPECGPLAVVCSAGVGRVGVFIALDMLIQQLDHRDRTISIYQLVSNLRQHRTMMVQTEQQYIFIHQCVKELLAKQRDPMLDMIIKSSRPFDPEVASQKQSLQNGSVILSSPTIQTGSVYSHKAPSLIGSHKAPSSYMGSHHGHIHSDDEGIMIESHS